MRLTAHAIFPILACLLSPAIPSNAFDFLRISPSPAANGRGGIYLPGNWDDSQCAFHNPAGLGFAVMRQPFGAGFSSMKWLPGWDFVDMSYRSFGLYAPLGQDEMMSSSVERMAPGAIQEVCAGTFVSPTTFSWVASIQTS